MEIKRVYEDSKGNSVVETEVDYSHVEGMPEKKVTSYVKLDDKWFVLPDLDEHQMPNFDEQLNRIYSYYKDEIPF